MSYVSRIESWIVDSNNLHKYNASDLEKKNKVITVE